MKRLWLILALLACEAPTVLHTEAHMAEALKAPVREIVDRKEDDISLTAEQRDAGMGGGTYTLDCGHKVHVTGEDWDECVMWEWRCPECPKVA